jgi:hypothetical protein
LRNLTILVALIAGAIFVIVLTAASVEFLPLIGAAAVLLFTFALAMYPTDDVRPTARRDETERHHW